MRSGPSTATGARSSSTWRSSSSRFPERILYRDVITYPPLREDLAFVVAEGAPAGDLMRAAREAAGEELREVRFLSDYRGEPIPAGKQVGRARVRLPVARADAVGRGRGAPAGRDRRAARRRVRRPAAHLNQIAFARGAANAKCSPDAERRNTLLMQNGTTTLRKFERQRLVASLVERKRLGTQLELIEALAAAGCHVTQATVSRDVRELGIVKTQDPLGRTRYSLPSRAGRVDPRELLDTLLGAVRPERGRRAEPRRRAVRDRLGAGDRARARPAGASRSSSAPSRATTPAWSSRPTRGTPARWRQI